MVMDNIMFGFVHVMGSINFLLYHRTKILGFSALEEFAASQKWPKWFRSSFKWKKTEWENAGYKRFHQYFFYPLQNKFQFFSHIYYAPASKDLGA